MHVIINYTKSFPASCMSLHCDTGRWLMHMQNRVPDTLAGCHGYLARLR